MAFVTLEPDEAWSIMSLVVSQMVDNAGVSTEGKGALRRWRGDRSVGTVEMSELTIDLNEAIGSVLDERTTRLIRRKGRYISTRDPLRG